MRAPLILAAVAVLLLLGRAAPAHADEGAAADGAAAAGPAAAAMHDYFAGEKRGGWLLVAMGVAGLGAGGVLLTRSSPTARGISYPLLGVGLAHVVAGVFVYLSSNRRIDRFEEQIAREPAVFAREEHARIGGVQGQFTALKIVEVVLIGGGAAMVVIGRRTDRPRLAGAGIGLAIEAAATLAFDVVAARRAADYRERLGQLQVAFFETDGDDAPVPGLAYSIRF